MNRSWAFKSSFIMSSDRENIKKRTKVDFKEENLIFQSILLTIKINKNADTLDKHKIYKAVKLGTAYFLRVGNPFFVVIFQ